MTGAPSTVVWWVQGAAHEVSCARLGSNRLLRARLLGSINGGTATNNVTARYNGLMSTPPSLADLSTTPVRLDLKRDEKLEIDWADGKKSVYSITLLRTMCPCAMCKMVREGTDPHKISTTPKKKMLLPILPGNFEKAITARNAQLVGNYAMKIEWSDNHDSGIYSFQYLRSLCPDEAR